MPEPQRARAFDRAERKFDLMQELGTDLMLVCSNVSPSSLGGIDRAAADFRELGERAARRGLASATRRSPGAGTSTTTATPGRSCAAPTIPTIGLILDSFHTLARKIDVNSIRSIPGDSIFIVQLADAPLIDMDLLYWSRHFRNMPGEGDLPVADFMRAVAATGYDGVLSLEIFNDQFRGGSPRTIAVDGHRSLVYLMDQVRRAASPASRLTLPAMPDRVAVNGVAFVEFAADESEAAELAAMLRALGFAHAGRHVSKDVDALPPGRHQHRHQHRARGLRPLRLSRPRHLGLCHRPRRWRTPRRPWSGRAALGADASSSRSGPGELTIPAIRGVGGGVIYFIDDKSELASVWEIEFRPVADERPPRAAGLKRIDHVAQTMNYEEMLTWLLFYTSIFATGSCRWSTSSIRPGWCAAR